MSVKDLDLDLWTLDLGSANHVSVFSKTNSFVWGQNRS